MSVLRYTFESRALHEELAALLTLPDHRPQPDEPLPAVLAFPAAGKEADYLLRATALEECSRPPYLRAVLCLPGRALNAAPEALARLMEEEIPRICELFRLEMRAVYAQEEAGKRKLTALKACAWPVGCESLKEML